MLALVLVRAGEGYTDEGTEDPEGWRNGERREVGRWDQGRLTGFGIFGTVRYLSFSGAS
jgi:hypothetical protein